MEPVAYEAVLLCWVSRARLSSQHPKRMQRIKRSLLCCVDCFCAQNRISPLARPALYLHTYAATAPHSSSVQARKQRAWEELAVSRNIYSYRVKAIVNKDIFIRALLNTAKMVLGPAAGSGLCTCPWTAARVGQYGLERRLVVDGLLTLVAWRVKASSLCSLSLPTRPCGAPMYPYCIIRNLHVD